MRLTALLIACLLSFVALEARADATAEALFRSGREAAEKGDWQAACTRFEESHRLEPAVGTAFNLANCREKLGQLASAWQRFSEVKQRLPQGDERLAVTDERIAALEPRLPKLTLQRGASAGEGSVTRDGIELGSGSFGLPLPVDPGKHVIVVRVPGRAERRYEIEIGEAEQKTLVVEAGEPAPAKSSPTAEDAATSATTPATAEDSGSRARTWGYVLGGVGIAGLATSAVAGALVLSKKSTVESECNGKLCTPEGVEAGEDGKLYSTISTVAFVAGAACVAAGVTLILTAKDGRETARLDLRAAPGAATLNLGGRF